MKLGKRSGKEYSIKPYLKIVNLIDITCVEVSSFEESGAVVPHNWA